MDGWDSVDVMDGDSDYRWRCVACMVARVDVGAV